MIGYDLFLQQFFYENGVRWFIKNAERSYKRALILQLVKILKGGL